MQIYFLFFSLSFLTIDKCFKFVIRKNNFINKNWQNYLQKLELSLFIDDFKVLFGSETSILILPINIKYVVPEKPNFPVVIG